MHTLRLDGSIDQMIDRSIHPPRPPAFPILNSHFYIVVSTLEQQHKRSSDASGGTPRAGRCRTPPPVPRIAPLNHHASNTTTHTDEACSRATGSQVLAAFQVERCGARVGVAFERPPHTRHPSFFFVVRIMMDKPPCLCCMSFRLAVTGNDGQWRGVWGSLTRCLCPMLACPPTDTVDPTEKARRRRRRRQQQQQQQHGGRSRSPPRPRADPGGVSPASGLDNRCVSHPQRPRHPQAGAALST
jgi:hypothetical protein